jgi:hypothetical protein
MNISTLSASKNIINHKLLFQCTKSIFIWELYHYIIISLNIKIIIIILYYELKWKDEIQEFKSIVFKMILILIIKKCTQINY